MGWRLSLTSSGDVGLADFHLNSLYKPRIYQLLTGISHSSPRINPAYPSLDDLSLFPFPREHNEPILRHLRVALNLFAGQLCFNDFDMYVSACRFLGLSWEKAKEDEVLDSDGFIMKDSEGRVGGGSDFTRSPVKFFRDLTLMRRDTQAITRTHVGDMLDNRPLSKDLFD